MRRPGNWHARLSVLVALVALGVTPAALAASQKVPHVTLIEAVGAIAAAGLIALLALLLARRGRLTIERTFGRARGAGAVRAARVLGTLGVCMGAAAGIALLSYWVLVRFLA
jgi:hypothetical protein